MPDESITSFRLSPQQARLWLTQADPAAAVTRGAFRLSGKLDPERLRAALEQIVERHEILRTSYHLPAGMRVPLQVVGEEPEIEWDLRRVADDEHELALTLPALSADAGTFAAIADELAAVYGETPDRLAEEPLQYADYAEWQHDLIDGDDEEAAAARAEWRAQGIEAIEPLDLPIESGGESTTFEAPAGTTAATALAAWQVLLTRLAGRSEVAVDVIVDGRDDDELRSALGVLAKPVTVRTPVDHSQPFAALVSAAEDALVRARRWQESVPVPADAVRQAAFEWRADSAARQAGALSVELAEVRWDDDSLPLKLTGIGKPDGVILEVSDARLAGSLRALIEDATARPGAAAAELNVVSDEDRALIASANDTSAEIPAVVGIHELFERQAALTPDRPAVAAAGQSVSYAELNERANRLARKLRAHGVGPDVPVGIFLERSIESVLALLAAQKAGGAAMPLSVEHPAGRLEHQLRDSGAVAVVTLERFVDRLPAWGGTTVCLDTDSDQVAAESGDDLDHIGTLDDVAYVIYTSGSTGLPKGVAVIHRGIVNYATDLCRQLGLEDGEPRQFALVSPIVTDLGNTCLYPSLVSGGCLHVIDEQTATDGALYGAYAEAHGIDVLKITPSHLAALLATGEASKVLPRQRLVTGGESCSWELVQTALDAGCRVLNHYGPTETTVGSLTFAIDSVPDVAERPAKPPIGRPIANTEVLIVDAAGQPVPVGVPGELLIVGDGLARGYVGNPEQTAERFVPHPSREGERAYRTGDLARWRADGTVEFLGRVDRQVKIRGFRVEPAEVEAALRRHPHVSQAAVALREDKPGDQRLVAYVVSTNGDAPSAQDLRGLAAEQVPDYMVPSAFVTLEALPLTANGKLDVAALPKPDLGRSNGHRERQGPRDETEAEVAAIWAEVLGTDGLDVNDDFFELGGHSLLATQVIARVRSSLGVQLPLHTLFTSPTVAGLAAAVRETRDASAPDEQDLAAMLEELENLSDEEAERLLGLENSQPDG